MRTTRRTFFAILAAGVACAAPSAAAAQGGFSVVIQPAGIRNAPHQQWVEQSQLLHQMAGMVNARFVIPGQALITARDCGVVNAFWDPNNRTMTLCYEIVDAIVREFRHDGLSQEAFATAVASATTFIAMHEIGHALVDLLDLPVTGREEDVVDQFATIALGHESPAPALWAAEFWRTKGDLGDLGLFKLDLTPFEDEHSFDMQRFYNVLCWTFGKDPRNRQEVLRVLPASRARRCPGEYQRMASSWNRIMAPHVRRAAAPAPAPLPAPVANLRGGWALAERIGSAESGMVCEAQIGMTIIQSGATFSAPFRQTGQCTIGGARSDNNAEGQIQGGRIEGPRVAFQMETCTYTGSLDGPASMSGTVACAVAQQDGSTVTVHGAWRAARQ